MAELGVPERRACRVLGQHRSTQRKPPRRPRDEAALTATIIALATQYGRYGYRRITAILNRQLRSQELAPANHKRVYRIMKAHNLLLARKYSERPEHVHDGKVMVMRSNLRWCSDGFEFVCWNGDIVRGAFIIDAHDREIIAWRAVVNAGISGSEIRDIMLEAVERRFGTYRTPSVIEMLSDNGSAYTARETRVFARQLGLKPCFTPVRSPQSNGISEAFVHTLKRDYVRVSAIPDALTALTSLAGWIEDYNDNHPHSGLKMRSPREHRALVSATA